MTAGPPCKPFAIRAKGLAFVGLSSGFRLCPLSVRAGGIGFLRLAQPMTWRNGVELSRCFGKPRERDQSELSIGVQSSQPLSGSARCLSIDRNAPRRHLLHGARHRLAHIPFRSSFRSDTRDGKPRFAGRMDRSAPDGTTFRIPRAARKGKNLACTGRRSVVTGENQRALRRPRNAGDARVHQFGPVLSVPQSGVPQFQRGQPR